MRRGCLAPRVQRQHPYACAPAAQRRSSIAEDQSVQLHPDEEHRPDDALWSANDLHLLQNRIDYEELETEFRGPSATRLGPVTSAAMQSCLASHLEAASLPDQSGYCACCGNMAPAAASDGHVFAIKEDGGDLFDDLFLHDRACYQGVHKTFIRKLADLEPAALKQKRKLFQRAGRFQGFEKAETRPYKLGLEELWLDDLVEVCYASNEEGASAEQRANFRSPLWRNAPASRWRNRTVLGYISAIPHYDGDEYYHVELLKTALPGEGGAEPPSLADRPKDIHQCPRNRRCPYRLMYHGLHGYCENPRHPTKEMYLLLGNRVFEPHGGLDGDGLRRSGFDVNAWHNERTGKMRVCKPCHQVLAKGGRPKRCIVRLQQSYVPTPFVGEDGHEQYKKCGQPSCRCASVQAAMFGHEEAAMCGLAGRHYLENHVRLLPQLSESSYMALSPVHNRGQVHRLIPSGARDRDAGRQGTDPLTAAARTSGTFLVADHTPGSQARGLQRGMLGHRIQFPHDLDGLFNILDDPKRHFPGPTTHREALSQYKVVCVAPQENEFVLRKVVNESKAFALDREGARGYARVFRLYNPCYKSDLREDVRSPAPL
jgi:hypothetical protein